MDQLFKQNDLLVLEDGTIQLQKRGVYDFNADQRAVRVLDGNGWYGPGWWGAGWYWNPWFGALHVHPGRRSLV